MKDKILIVEDTEVSLTILTGILEGYYEVLTAETGTQAIRIIENFREELHAVLLDLMIPEIDGFGVFEFMNKKKYISKIPVIVISSDSNAQTEERCFDYGASDFIKKPFNNALVLKRVKNTVELHRYRNELENKVSSQTKMLRKQTETLKKQNQLLLMQADKLKKSNENIIDILGNVVESRSLENAEHVRKIKAISRILATRLMKDYPEYGLTKEQVDLISNASALHDIGKITIPDNILNKPGKLTDMEFDYMKSHTTRGSEIVNNIKGVWDEKYSKASYEICRHHHERYDGKGYPDGLAGEEIPLSAQIVSVADAYDALISERVYKSAVPPEQAFRMIITGECGVFSPKVMESFRNAYKEIEALLN